MTDKAGLFNSVSVSVSLIKPGAAHIAATIGTNKLEQKKRNCFPNVHGSIQQIQKYLLRLFSIIRDIKRHQSAFIAPNSGTRRLSV